MSRGRRMDNWRQSRFVGRECGRCFSDLTADAFGLLTCGPNGHLARMSVTHQLHLQLSPMNAALTFWRDGDRFRREACFSDGRGFGRPGRKKEEDARAAAGRSAEIQARWGVADKAGKENDGAWPACEK